MKTALFGGTFDPIHNGHLAIAKAAADRFGLDRVLFIPSGRPPHKDSGPQASYEDRFRMTQLACAADERFEASRLEDPATVGTGKTYSIDTIESVLATLPPGDSLHFLIGQDAFDELGIWHRLEDVVLKVDFIVASRPNGGSSATREGVPAGARFFALDEVDVPVSATQIRALVRNGESLSGSVPVEVAVYIQRKGLYQKEEGSRPAGRLPVCL